MKSKINTPVAVAIVIALIVIAGLAIWKGGQPAREAAGRPPGMPNDVAAEMQKRMAGTVHGITAPTSSAMPGMGGMNGTMAPGGYGVPGTGPH
jgi:hypothetical protein